MFTINKNQELDELLLYKMLNKYKTDVQPKLQTYKKYYDGNQNILAKSYNDSSKPCNRTVTNFCQNITDSYSGYIASPSYISYSSEDDIEDIMSILKYNDYQEQDNKLLSDALIFGYGAELMYMDSEAQVRFKNVSPLSCFPIYDNSLTDDLLYFVRFYVIDEWSNDNLYYVDVYNDVTMKRYKSFGINGKLELVSEEPHYFSQCPANVLIMPEEKSIFDCIMGLQDSYNEILTSEIDDYSAFVDAFLALYGADADEDSIVSMKQNRVLILPEGANAQWLVKQTNDTQIENMLKRVQDSIYRIAAAPDFSSDSFTNGVSSGVAIRYKLTGMETRAARIEAIMKKALQRRVEIICGMVALKLGENIFRDIVITFTRNVPTDGNEIINTVNSLRGLVSNETLLSMIPQITEPAEEVRKAKEEQMNILGLYDE